MNTDYLNAINNIKPFYQIIIIRIIYLFSNNHSEIIAASLLFD
jgi:hypothetical protein